MDSGMSLGVFLVFMTITPLDWSQSEAASLTANSSITVEIQWTPTCSSWLPLPSHCGEKHQIHIPNCIL